MHTIAAAIIAYAVSKAQLPRWANLALVGVFLIAVIFLGLIWGRFVAVGVVLLIAIIWLLGKYGRLMLNRLNRRELAWTNLATIVLLLGVGIAWLLGLIPERPRRGWMAAREGEPEETVTIMPTATLITEPSATPTTEPTATPITESVAIPTTEPTPTPTALPPIAPSGPEVSNVSDYSIGLLWEDQSVDESGFQVERSINGEDWQLVTTTLEDVEAFTDTDLKCETHYYYRICAYRESDQQASEYGSVVEDTTERCPWMYVVKEGDDLYSLAQTFYGDRDIWADIFNRNRTITGELQESEDIPPIYPGQILLLPDLPPEIPYVIQPRDELDDIARRYYGHDYGSPDLWTKIQDCNPDLEDPTRLPVNASLTICRLDALGPGQIIVRPEDSLDRISDAYYGRKTKASKIYQENEGVIGEVPQKIQPWMILTLPDLHLLMRDEHEVKESETLSSIATDCYGDSSLWPDIQFVNRRVLGDRITQPRIGQVLTLYECRR